MMSSMSHSGPTTKQGEEDPIKLDTRLIMKRASTLIAEHRHCQLQQTAALSNNQEPPALRAELGAPAQGSAPESDSESDEECKRPTNGPNPHLETALANEADDNEFGVENDEEGMDGEPINFDFMDEDELEDEPFRPSHPLRVMSDFQLLRQELLYKRPDEVPSLEDLQRYIRILVKDRRQDFTLYDQDLIALHQNGVKFCNQTFIQSKYDAIAKQVAERVYKEFKQLSVVPADRLDVAGVKEYPLAEAPEDPNNMMQPTYPAMVIIDPFCGSGNSMFWFQRTFNATCYGIESHPKIFEFTREALRENKFCRVIKDDYLTGMRRIAAAKLVPREALLMFVLDPPWGKALRQDPGPEKGSMDLAMTEPPIELILKNIIKVFPNEVQQGRVLVTIHTLHKFSGKTRFSREVVLNHFTEVKHGFAFEDYQKRKVKQGYIFGWM